MKPPPGETRLLALIYAAIAVAAGAVMLWFLRPIL
jgi:hypothetical protein